MARREKGSGSWDTVTKNDITYYRYRKKYVGMTSRKEFVGRTKADVKRKIQEFEAKSMRVNQKDYNNKLLLQLLLLHNILLILPFVHSPLLIYINASNIVFLLQKS